MKDITIYIPSQVLEACDLSHLCSLADIVALGPQTSNENGLSIKETHSTESLRAIIRSCKTPYLILWDSIKAFPDLSLQALSRLIHVAKDSDAGLIYTDFREKSSESSEVLAHPLAPYQKGSIRDDFDFGPLILLNLKAARNALATVTHDYRWAGLYFLRLSISIRRSILHLREFLYTATALKVEAEQGERQFDYVNPRNREVQIEMEEACKQYLSAIYALITPFNDEADISEGTFPCEASVIIPVRNRVRTISDAIHSALSQETTFPFNVIVVDNHSTDGTTEAIASIAQDHANLVHIIPEEKDLGIGGCWNKAILDERCGRFAVQLDSDDLYSTKETLSKIVSTFHKERCAAVVGSYSLTDFELNPLPPGLIDHREWTAENGRNNALRINGLGAPRAFYVPVIRDILFPNVSYGEDYAAMLAISRNHRIGRIFESLYLCRRWAGNSDAALSQEAINRNNTYKDMIRTIEIEARIRKLANN